MSTLTYVYCLVRSARRPAISRRSTAEGMPGGRNTRAVPAGDNLWMIAATVPAAGYDEAALASGIQNLDWVGRRALAHEAVVEQFLAAKAVLPMQLFTLFTSDERALQHVTRQRPEILAILGRLERKLEWGLRLTFDEKAARAAVEADHAGPAKALRPAMSDARTGATRAGGGASYLTRKRELLDIHRVQLLAARGEADKLFAALSKDAAEARRRTTTEETAPGARLLLDAAFLVPASRTRSFRAAVGRKSKQIAATGVVVSLTGPWPPYNFISEPAGSARIRSAKSRGKAAR